MKRSLQLIDEIAKRQKLNYCSIEENTFVGFQGLLELFEIFEQIELEPLYMSYRCMVMGCSKKPAKAFSH